MDIQEVISALEQLAPPAYQESYDNAGLITGSRNWDCTGILVSLDVTEDVVAEALAVGANLIVAHHPVIFRGLKQLTGRNYVERTIIAAIKNDIAIYAIHTNLDNLLPGVNAYIADKLGLVDRRVLQPKADTLRKLVCFVPGAHLQKVQDAVFAAGAGTIGNYDECGFQSAGTGSFRPGSNTNPFVGEKGERHLEPELRFETIFPAAGQSAIIKALLEAHPYEEVAYDIYPVENFHSQIGSGLIGKLDAAVSERDMLERISQAFKVPVVRHTPLLGKPVQTVALCGGAGSFLIANALRAGADIFLTADVKYHEFFDADGQMVLADIGHYESEQYTIDLLYGHLLEKFTTFAVRKTSVKTNPVHYFLAGD